MTIQEILNFNLNKSIPRGKKHQEIIDFLLKNTNLNKNTICNHLDNIFNISDVNLRSSAIFASFLISYNTEIIKLFKPSYVNSIPYPQDLNIMIYNMKILFKRNKILSECPEEVIDKSMRLIYNYSYEAKTKDDEFNKVLLLQAIYFNLKQININLALSVDKELKKIK